MREERKVPRIPGRKTPVGGKVKDVVPGSAAWKSGIEPGDIVVGLGGRPPRDIIDYWFYTASPAISLEVIKKDGGRLAVRLKKEEDEDPGIVFHEVLFDGLITCKNDCIFCFVDQLPPGLRNSLYLKDDDYRLSFLHGNFITLNSLSPRDYRRIVRQRLSPLYVSVHTTSADVRQYLMGNVAARHILRRLKRLTSAGVVVHSQIVICPGINDGEHLKRSVEDLARLRPNLRTVGVVPVGTTRYTTAKGNRPAVRRPTETEARSVIEQVEDLGERFLGETGRRFVYPADEWYVIAGRTPPDASFYDDFEQLQNGIGMLALATENVRKAMRSTSRPRHGRSRSAVRPMGGCDECKIGLHDFPRQKHVMVITAPAAYPRVMDWIEGMRRAGAFEEPGVRVASPVSVDGIETGSVYLPGACCEITLASVNNEIFGPQVDVTGLLAGRDVMRAIHAILKKRAVHPEEFGAPLALGWGGIAIERATRIKGPGKSQAATGGVEAIALIPGNCVTPDEHSFLDGVTVLDVEKELGARIRTVDPLNGEIVSALRGAILGTPEEVEFDNDHERRYAFRSTSFGHRGEA